MDPYVTPFEEVAELAWIFADGLVGASAPRLAARIPSKANGDIDATGLTIVYRLRTDARWHDGKPFVAHDVVDAHARLLASHPSWHNTPPYSNVARIEALDSARLRVTLRRPDASFVRLFFAAYGSLPVPIVRVEGTRLLGTAPFRIADTSVARTTFERVRLGGTFDRIALVNYAEAAPTALALRAGEVDIVVPMDRSVARSEHLHLVGKQSGVVYIVANTQGALHDAATRKAILAAIDVDTIAKRVFRSASTDALLAGVRIDPPKVKTLPPLPPLRIAYGKSPAIEEIALLLADGLRRRGVATTLRAMPLAQYEPAMRSGEFDLAIDAGSYAVPEDLVSMLSCENVSPRGANYSRICDPALERALANANLAEIGVRLNDDAPLRTIAPYEQYAAIGSRLTMPETVAFTPWFANLEDWTLR